MPRQLDGRSPRLRRASAWVAALAFTVATLPRLEARADNRQSAAAAAEALFQEGRALLMAGDTAQACPKLEESQRLDPASGTLLALALCQEQQGKLASAWAAFAEVEGRSRLDGRADRERTAHEHGAALKPRLSTLTLELAGSAAATPGLAITVDGVAIGRGAWSVAIPVDGGPHVLEATATGRTGWRTTASVAPEGDHVLVDIPALAMAPGPAPRAPAPPPEPPRHAAKIAALALGGAGAVALVAGAILIVQAKHDYDAAEAQCTNHVCPSGPYESAQSARRRGDWATALAIGGGVLVAAGAVLWLWPARRREPAGLALGLRPGGLMLVGRF